jgi:hypothetical protein
MVLKHFTICDQLLQRSGTGGFIRANPVLFVPMVLFLFIRGLFVEIFFDTT